jgi:hypothetical protein
VQDDDETPNASQSKHEARKAARLRRQLEWDAFMATKPDEACVNAEDEEAIQHAEHNMGDFKLKSDKNFVPDEQQRMTPDRTKQKVRSGCLLLGRTTQLSSMSGLIYCCRADSSPGTRASSDQDGLQ